MIDLTNCNIESVSVHKVGNITNGEELALSKFVLDISDNRLREILLKFFLTPFTNVEYYSFSFSNDDFTLNPIYNFVLNIFNDFESFHNHSIDVAKHLFEISVHPQIKSGDLFLAFFTDIIIDGDLTDAVGIFKSDNKQAFLQLNNVDDDFSLQFEDGINIEKLDKGCLIFNVNKEHGFKVCIIDKLNKSGEAQFWKDSFLNIEPLNDNYHQTKDFLNITKNYVTKQLNEEFGVSKTDQIELLNRSVDYFKSHEKFEKEEFEAEVLQDDKIIKSFRNFDESYRETNEIEASDNFDISTQAVKKQARLLKSVLKLDKNFHIYIHGDSSLIEPGKENDGRKYYKIYYQSES